MPTPRLRLAYDLGPNKGEASLSLAEIEKLLAQLDGKIEPELLAKVKNALGVDPDPSFGDPDVMDAPPPRGGAMDSASRAHRAAARQAADRDFDSRYPPRLKQH